MTTVNLITRYGAGPVNLVCLIENLAEQLGSSYGEIQLRPVSLRGSFAVAVRACDFRHEAEVSRIFLVPAGQEEDDEFVQTLEVYEYTVDGVVARRLSR